MSIEEWKEIFTNVGSLVIGFVLACGQLYTIWQMKKQEKTNIEKEQNKTKYGKMIKDENKYTLEIQTQLEELRQALNADRTQIIEFHNGTDFSTRKGYKMDCTYESVKFGNDSVKGILKDYPTTLLPIFISKIVHDGKYFVSDKELIRDKDMSTYSMKTNMNISAFYDVALSDGHDVIGILVVQYALPKELNEEDIAMLHAKKIIIEELMK